MKILVDADACPKPIKEIVYRAANRLNIRAIFFANHHLNLPNSKFLSFKQVPKGFDVADNEIVDMVESNDIVITADIPLASDVVAKYATAINVRGEVYTETNIKQKLTMRNFMSDMRDAGVATGGPKPLSKRDIQDFANSLDRILAAN